MTRIVLTGGGTAGHVMPHLAMLPLYKGLDWELIYIGSSGIEKDLARDAGLTYYTIQTGKLRRYFSLENFFDIFRLIVGVLQSFQLLLKLKPDLVFSKGGFVSVPVAFAAWVLRIPVVSHESDLTPGLANRLIEPFCSIIFHAFPETARYLKAKRKLQAGIPVRDVLFRGDAQAGRALCGFQEADRKTILVMGGSLGAERINLCLQEILPNLVSSYNVVHLTGKGKQLAFTHERYKAFEYVSGGLENIFACADLVVSRAGANSLFELKALRKPMLLIPLEIGSRGDQVHNAKSFEKMGWAQVLSEKELSPESLEAAIRKLSQESDSIVKRLAETSQGDAQGQGIIVQLQDLLQKKGHFSH